MRKLFNGNRLCLILDKKRLLPIDNETGKVYDLYVRDEKEKTMETFEINKTGESGMAKRKALTTGKIAQYCDVNVQTVLKWISDEKMKAYQLPSGGNRVKIEDFIAFLKEFEFPIPEEFSHGAAPRVLLVDDDKDVVDVLGSFFEKNNYVVDVAFDGFQAGEKVAEYKPDAIVLDINMPHLDGYEVLKRIKSDEAKKHIKVIVSSGNIDEEAENKLIALKADAIMKKPVIGDEIVAKVATLLK